QILTNEQGHSPKRRVTRPYPVPTCEVPLFVEHAIGREIDFTVHMANLPFGQIDRSVIEAKVWTFFDQADDERNLAAPLFEPGHFRGIGTQRHRRHHVTEMVAGQAEFGKYEQIEPLLPRLVNVPFAQGQVGLQIPQARVYLPDPYNDLGLHWPVLPLRYNFHK